MIYIFVGGQGCTSNSSEGSNTDGDFPDGGGTKTGIYGNADYCTTVPGTGGGSTSIRIGSDDNNARVIVAGGGGGASGCTYYVDPGGFGGGLSGGNCYYKGSLQSQGAGTQTGSTRGLGYGDDRNGDLGTFGSGATGKYKKDCTSGGGGGGGWYGGGSGGYGCLAWCSSGGGGSGWTFTESSLKTFQSGDSSNASKFILTSSYYLRDAICVGGNEEFPRPDGKGNERGHAGNEQIGSSESSNQAGSSELVESPEQVDSEIIDKTSDTTHQVDSSHESPDSASSPPAASDSIETTATKEVPTPPAPPVPTVAPVPPIDPPSASSASVSQAPNYSNSNESKSGSKKSLSLIIGIVVGVFALLLIVLIIIILVIRKKRNKQNTSGMENQSEKVNNEVEQISTTSSVAFKNPLFNGNMNSNDPFDQVFNEDI